MKATEGAAKPEAAAAAGGKVLDPVRLHRFERDGYLVLDECVPTELIEGLEPAFDAVWDTCEEAWAQALEPVASGTSRPALTHPECVDFLDSDELLAAPRQLLGEQIQLVDFFPVYQSPRRWPSGAEREPDRGWIRVPERGWHRDFSFTTRRGDAPVMVTVLLFLDQIGEEQGPTVVLPGSHLDPAPPADLEGKLPYPGEVKVPLAVGDALLLNGSLLHSHARNASATPRRGLVMMFAYWWVKQHSPLPLPDAATVGADPTRRRLLGLEQPTPDLFIYD
jgi:Phytanoyl-CoA dioxygenase (PhyH)